MSAEQILTSSLPAPSLLRTSSAEASGVFQPTSAVDVQSFAASASFHLQTSFSLL
jgi:hypothetical protein